MTFDEFKANVQRWAEERGIYEHSTRDAQLLKAMSELGELSDAFIKKDMAGVKDGVGDVAVCLVNALVIDGCAVDWDLIPFKNLTTVAIGELASTIGTSWLDDIAINNGFSINECFDHAWNEIKDRKGHMVAGGVFVKDAS